MLMIYRLDYVNRGAYSTNIEMNNGHFLTLSGTWYQLHSHLQVSGIYVWKEYQKVYITFKILSLIRLIHIIAIDVL